VPTLFTIGHERRSLREFIHLLRNAGVDAVIDVRLRNTSALVGYTKKDDLAFLLAEGFGLAYEHRPELAPTPEILDAYRQEPDWDLYVQRFSQLLQLRSPEAAGREILAAYRAPCLMCYEADPARCHRRLVAEWWATRLPGLDIVHL